MYERKKNKKHTTQLTLFVAIYIIYMHICITFHKFQDISQQQHQRALIDLSPLKYIHSFIHYFFRYTNNLLITDVNNLQ